MRSLAKRSRRIAGVPVGALLVVVSFGRSAGANPPTPVPEKPGGGDLLVSIEAPLAGELLSNVLAGGESTVEVRGRVGGVALADWILEAGVGVDPSSWARVAAGVAPVSGEVLASWQTASLPNGPVVLRLLSRASDGKTKAVTTPVRIAHLRVTQDVLQANAGAAERVTYRTTVPFLLQQKLELRNQRGYVVRTLVDAKRDEGLYLDTWDLRDDAARPVPDGPYFFVATAESDGGSMVLDLTGEYLDNFFDSKDGLAMSAFDPFANRPLVVRYTTQVAGLTTVSVFNRGIQRHDCEQPPEQVLCLVKYKYEAPGDHTFVWAGVDASGAFVGNLYSKISITTTRDRFAKNAVVVYGTSPRVADVIADPTVIAPPLQQTAVSFALSTFRHEPAEVVVAFLSQSSRSTLRTIRLSGVMPGRHTVTWDGRADNGALVAPGGYTVTVAATDNLGNQASGQVLLSVLH